MVESILRIAVLIVLGGGSFVMPILIELERLGSKTINSLFFVDSCAFCAGIKLINTLFSVEHSKI